MDPSGKSASEAGQEGIDALRKFWDSIGAPSRLADYDIDDSRIDEMAEKAVRFGPFGNFRKLDREDTVEIYKMSL
ncbi:NADH-dependent butanol dehydrogenase A [compost metagenome]